VREREQVLVPVLVPVQERVLVLVQEREMHTQPSCLPVSLLILR
jgi:hypothetical protein